MLPTEAVPPRAILMLGAPLPPPYGGIASYLQRAAPHLSSAGFVLHLIQPDARVASPGPSAGGGPWKWITTEGFVVPGRLARAAFICRNITSLAPFIARYLEPFRSDWRFARGQFSVFLTWCMLAERAGRHQRPQIVHAFDSPWLQGAAAVWAARRFKARSVVTIFGEVVPHLDELRQIDEVSPAYRALSRLAVERADAATSMTEHCREQVLHIGVDPARLEIVRLVVGMSEFEPAPGRDAGAATLRVRYAPQGGPLLLYVGQVRQRKGPQTLVEALPFVLASYPSARLLIVGPDHGFGSELRGQAEREGVGHAVSLVGSVAASELPTYYAACDVFLFPSLTPIECLGLTFVQAMFAAKPVVATRIAGAPEVIQDGCTGTLVPPGDAQEFASRIVALLDLSPEDRRAIGLRGQGRVRELFSERAVLADIEGLYNRLLEAFSGR